MNLVEQFKDVGVKEVPKVKKKVKETREDRAKLIAYKQQQAIFFNKPPMIVQVTKNTIAVASITRSEHSNVEYKFGEWVCDCPDAKIRGRLCKHNIAIIYCRMNGIKIPTFDEAMEMIS